MQPSVSVREDNENKNCANKNCVNKNNQKKN